MKRTLLLLALTLVLIFGATVALDTPVSAATSGTTGACTWQLNGSNLYVWGNGPMADYGSTDANGNVVMPPWYDYAFEIKQVFINEGVTSIGDYAFANCLYLEAIAMPSSLTRIGNGAFLNCYSIPYFYVPKNVTQLGIAVFAGLTTLQPLAVAEGNPVYTAAGNCIIEKSTNTVVLGCSTSQIPAGMGIRAIGEGAFALILNSATVTIPEGVTTVGEGAFLAAEIGAIRFPEGLKKIPAYCCSESTLGTVTFPSTLEEIGEEAFSYCENLKSVTLPEKLKTIGTDAFWACALDGKIAIPKSTQYVGVSAFSANPQLRGFEIAEDHSYLKEIADCLVEKATGTVISGGVSSGQVTFYDESEEAKEIRAIGDYAFAYTDISIVQIPENVESIGEGAFLGCEFLKIVRFDSEFTAVGDYAFADCGTIVEFAIQKYPPTFVSTTFENTSFTSVWVEGATSRELNAAHLPVFASATWHYVDHPCDTQCKECIYIGRISTIGTAKPHSYTDVCDPDCNFCGAERTEFHAYTNVCDPDCNVCGASRQIEGHVYDSACDPDCNKCKEVRSVPDHVYDSACDPDCNVCHKIRTAEAAHSYPYECSENCTLCGQWRDRYHIAVVATPAHAVQTSDTAPFIMDSDGWYRSTNTAAGSSAAFTLTASHHCFDFSVVYQIVGKTDGDSLKMTLWGSPLTPDGENYEQTKTFGFYIGNPLCLTFTKAAASDSYVRFKFVCECPAEYRSKAEIVTPSCKGAIVCDYCGTVVKEALAHTYDNVCDADCSVCGETRTPPHVFDNACDTSCNDCGATRQVNDHTYDSACDPDCNVCGVTRSVEHVYDDACDDTCNLCTAKRKAPHVYSDKSDLVCNECEYERPPYVLGDVTGDDEVNLDDAIYLLYHVNFPALYDVNQPVDFNGDGKEDLDDAIYLLYHVNFPALYPLQ